MERWARAAEEAGLVLELEDGSAGSAWCARSDLDRAVDVLIENAVAYSPRGSRVVVCALADGLEVVDGGHGLRPGEEEQVFERFHRGSAGRSGPPGSGLGLPIARELMQRWGGTATIANRPEGGARAALTLPREHGERGFTGSLPADS